MPGERQGCKGINGVFGFSFSVAIFEANEEGQEHVKHLQFLKDSKLKVIQGSLWFRYAKADQSFWEADWGSHFQGRGTCGKMMECTPRRAENLVFSSQPVSSQDVILHIIGIIGTAGGTGCVIEFCSLSKFRGEWGCWRQRWIDSVGNIHMKQYHEPFLSSLHEANVNQVTSNLKREDLTSIIFWSWRWRRLREHVHGGMLILRRKRARRKWCCQMVEARMSVCNMTIEAGARSKTQSQLGEIKGSK